MKWFLVWLIVTTNPDGSIESRLYETQVQNEIVCLAAQKKLDERLLNGYDNFTTSCEYR
jgi:hypothetical protein